MDSKLKGLHVLLNWSPSPDAVGYCRWFLGCSGYDDEEDERWWCEGSLEMVVVTKGDGHWKSAVVYQCFVHWFLFFFSRSLSLSCLIFFLYLSSRCKEVWEKRDRESVLEWKGKMSIWERNVSREWQEKGKIRWKDKWKGMKACKINSTRGKERKQK